MATDPGRLATYRALARARATCVASGEIAQELSAPKHMVTSTPFDERKEGSADALPVKRAAER